MRLEDIGFYTLSDARAANASATSPMWRCEMILTDKCNFHCPYCRKMREECRGTTPTGTAIAQLSLWADDGLKNVRFSGGEPTLHSGIVEIVAAAKEFRAERIALSTNGSAPRALYDELVRAGVNDISISLDSCCAAGFKQMAGRDEFASVIANMRYLAERVYVTVGMVFTDDNAAELVDLVQFADELGVADIRIISAAQYDKVLEQAKRIPPAILRRHPILNYRVGNILRGRRLRGLSWADSGKCSLLQDDSCVAGDYHFPCIIYFREGGEPIGRVGLGMRRQRVRWMETKNTHEEPICWQNCLDVCVDYNNKAAGKDRTNDP